jgi:hypothetical protein
MRLTLDKQNEYARELVRRLRELGDELVKRSARTPTRRPRRHRAQRERVAQPQAAATA